MTGFVFLGTRSFADAHELCFWIAFSGYSLSRRFIERAPRALLHLLGDLLESVELLDRAGNELRFSGSDDDAFLECHVGCGFRRWFSRDRLGFGLGLGLGLGLWPRARDRGV